MNFIIWRRLSLAQIMCDWSTKRWHFCFDSGSALHRHLLESGLGDVELSSPASSDRSLLSHFLCPSPFSHIRLSPGLLPVSWQLWKRENTLLLNFWCVVVFQPWSNFKANPQVPPPLPSSTNGTSKRLTSVIWPDAGNKILEVHIWTEKLFLDEDQGNTLIHNLWSLASLCRSATWHDHLWI